jgi:diguanylate cyclase (GGDEF)-like protein/PAS domain S-box-containing protein
VSAAAQHVRSTSGDVDDALYRLIVESAREGIWVVDTGGRTLFANARMAELLAVEKRALLDGAIWDFVDPSASEIIRERMARRSTGARDEYELPFVRIDGQQRWLLVSAVPLPGQHAGFSGSIGISTDITDRKESERQLRQLALYDSLTKLPNRTLIAERHAQLLDRRDNTGEEFGYAVCDIDHLKRVNDLVGHRDADLFIAEVATRLREAARGSDVVGRTGGDEFAVLLPGADSYIAQRLAENLVTAVSGPIVIGGTTLNPSVSIGVASTSDVAPGGLMAAADAALFLAKAKGRGRAVVHDPNVSLTRPAFELVAELRHALDNDLLELHYQPIMRLSDNQPIGVEALVRWHHPERGAVPPATFVPLAEDYGLIAQLGQWALQRACRDAVSWNGNPYVWVNLSGRQLTVPGTVEAVRRALAVSGLAPSRLTLEVTETAVVADIHAAGRMLRELAELGVCIALDDFGTGYSSLAYLRDFPVSAIKIDRSFIAGLDHNDDDDAIVATLVNLATTLGLHIVAEGVENEAQCTLLRGLGCPLGQGHLWSAAVPAAEVPALLRNLARAQPVSHAQRPSRRSSREPPNASTLGRILALHRTGASPSTIAAALNADGLRTPALSRWHRSSIARVIADTVVQAPSRGASQSPRRGPGRT